MNRQSLFGVALLIVTVQWCPDALRTFAEFAKSLSEVDALKLLPYALLLMMLRVVGIEHELLSILVQKSSKTRLPTWLIQVFWLAMMISFVLLLNKIKS